MTDPGLRPRLLALVGLAPATGPRRGTGDGVRIRDHLAAVRTVLAWQRAAVALCAVAVVLVRLRSADATLEHVASTALVLVAAALMALAAVRLVRARDQLLPGALERNALLTSIQLALVAAAAVLLAVLAARGDG